MSSPRTPWLWIGLAFWAGTSVPSGPSILALIGALALALGGLRRVGAAVIVAALLGGSAAGLAQRRWLERPAPPISAPFAGRVVSTRPAGGWLLIDVAPDARPGDRVRVGRIRRQAGLALGARVRVAGPLRAPRPAENPGGYDERGAMGRARVRWRASGPARLLEAAPLLSRLPWRAREGARRRLAQTGQPLGAAVLGGLLLGDRAGIPAGAVAAFQGSGTAHLLAVSGLHIGGLAAALGWCLVGAARRLGSAQPRRWAALALPAVVGMAGLAWFPISATRAGLMVGLYLTGLAVCRRARPLNLLGLAMLVALAGDPGAGSAPGFQFSFGAVAALLAVGSRRGGLLGIAAAAGVAAAATAPVQAWHFGTCAPIGPLANLLLVPPVTLAIVPLGALGLLLAPLSLLPLRVAAWLAERLVEGAGVLSEAAGGSWRVGAHAWWWAALPLALLLAWRLRRPVVGSLVAAILLVGGWWAHPPTPTVDFVAVGQGDAIVIRGGGRAVLVDGGPDPAGRTLLSYLRHEGIGRLEAIVLSHAHPDHFGGLARIVEALPVGRLVYNGTRGRGPAWRRLEAALARRGLRPQRAREGLLARLGALDVRVVAGPSPERWPENDRSVVVQVEGPRGDAVLLPGDVEVHGERRLLGLAPARATGVSVLKAAHHGSRTSSDPVLLEQLAPSDVVFTVGARNRFGFPHPEVVDRFEVRGTRVWRTDVDGRVRVRWDPLPVVEGWRRRCSPAGQRGG